MLYRGKNWETQPTVQITFQGQSAYVGPQRSSSYENDENMLMKKKGGSFHFQKAEHIVLDY